VIFVLGTCESTSQLFFLFPSNIQNVIFPPFWESSDTIVAVCFSSKISQGRLFGEFFSSFYKQNKYNWWHLPQIFTWVNWCWDYVSLLVISDRQRDTHTNPLFWGKKGILQIMSVSRRHGLYLSAPVSSIWRFEWEFYFCFHLPSPQKGVFWYEAVYQFSDVSQHTLRAILLLQQTRLLFPW